MDTHDAAPAAAKTPKDAPTIWRVDDALWAELRPLLVVDKPRKKPGRPRRDDRTIFDGLIWLARNGGGGRRRRASSGPSPSPTTASGSGSPTAASTRPGRAASWCTTARSGSTGSGGPPTSASSRPRWATRGAGAAEATGRNPVERGKCGCKRHRLTEGRGFPIAVVLSGGNPTDMKKLVDLLDAIVVEEPPLPPAAGGEPGGRELCLARGYADDECRAAAAERGDRAHIPPARRQGQPLPPPGHPDRHPPRRRVVEVAHSWFDRFRHLLIRWDKRTDHYLAYVHLAAFLIVYREIRHARTLSG